MKPKGWEPSCFKLTAIGKDGATVRMFITAGVFLNLSCYRSEYWVFRMTRKLSKDALSKRVKKVCKDAQDLPFGGQFRDGKSKDRKTMQRTWIQNGLAHLKAPVAPWLETVRKGGYTILVFPNLIVRINITLHIPVLGTAFVQVVLGCFGDHLRKLSPKTDL